MRVLIALFAAAVALQAQGSALPQTELAIQQAIQAGDLTTASRLIDAALKRHPREAGLLNLRGIVHGQRNEVNGAHEDFAEAARIDPGLTPAWQNLARTCQLEDQQEGSSCAIDAWQHVLRLEPADVEARGSLALLFEGQGKFAESLRALEKLPAERAAGTENLALKCADLCGLGRIADAEAAASRLAQRADLSESHFETMQRALESPQSAAVVVTLVEALDAHHAASLANLRRLAIAYEQLQRIPDARKTLERIAMKDPANTAHLLELARLAELTKDYEGALGYLGHARELAPKNPRIHFLFGIIAAEMNLPVEARRSLERALALDPENADYNYAMGSVLLSTRDAATASIYLQKYARARPGDPKGKYALGIAYFASGDYEKAKEQMQTVESNPKATAGAEYFLGCIARLQGDLEGAARRLRRSIELMPSFSESHTELARVFMEQGKMQEAHAELDRAVELDPQTFEGNAQLLALYRRTRDPRAAKQAELLKKLDEDRSKRAELMLRTVEVRP